MNRQLDESYESWVERVRMFEQGAAMKELALGKPIDQVMEKMAKRIMDKLMHPVYADIKQNIKVENLDTSKQTYKEKYLDKQSRLNN
jgi:glutamyl-tRNA reductase